MLIQIIHMFWFCKIVMLNQIVKHVASNSLDANRNAKPKMQTYFKQII